MQTKISKEKAVCFNGQTVLIFLRGLYCIRQKSHSLKQRSGFLTNALS
ncbi:MAG: hypothetical protein JWQ63_2463 [Mucilaginibacter sp.]|nr:hypothetical protein [Mucilaginibacter sp.]